MPFASCCSGCNTGRFVWGKAPVSIAKLVVCAWEALCQCRGAQWEIFISAPIYMPVEARKGALMEALSRLKWRPGFHNVVVMDQYPRVTCESICSEGLRRPRTFGSRLVSFCQRGHSGEPGLSLASFGAQADVLLREANKHLETSTVNVSERIFVVSLCRRERIKSAHTRKTTWQYRFARKWKFRNLHSLPFSVLKSPGQ